MNNRYERPTHRQPLMLTTFRLLGDVEALADGNPIDIGHARQLCVLTVLLVEANQAVPAGTLIDRVWADRPPQRVRNTLSGYLSRLRDALSIAKDVEIVKRPAGYVLLADPTAIDTHCFRRLVAEARSASDPGESATLYGAALALWRGEPFATLDTPWLNDVRGRLLAERRAAELDRNDLALAHGQHAQLLVELATAAQADPLDERLAAQYMLALYRSGRQAVALRHYERLRGRLREELGVSPEPDLQHLYLRITRSDPGLVPPTVAARHAVPHQLPAPPPSFAGRIDELTRLDSMLAADHAPAVVISALAGTAGVGKTALAVHWAHRVADRFPDGQLYANLRGFDPSGQIADPGEVCRRFLDDLGVPAPRIPADPDARAAMYRKELGGRRVLIVLDNARDTAQVRPLLPGAPACLVLVTSRNQLTGLIAADGALPVALNLLSSGEAGDLLAHRLGRPRLAAEPDAVAEIIAACARLPLALAIVAARAATSPQLSLRALAGRLRDTDARLDTLTTDDPDTGVRAVFSWSYQALSPAAARMFRLLGLHPGPDISAAAVASLTALPMGAQRTPLTELIAANLLTETVPGRYAFHDLLRAYATELTGQVDPAHERGAATHRMLDHYLHSAYAAARLLFRARDPLPLGAPQPGVNPEVAVDHTRALEWLTTEHPVLLAVAGCAAGAGFDTHAWQLAWALADFLDRRGHWHDRAATGRAAVAATRRLTDPRAQAKAHGLLAHAYIRLGDLDGAAGELRHALELTVQTGDRVGQADAHHIHAIVCDRQGLHGDALGHAQRALALYDGAGHRVGQARALSNIGWYHAQLGAHEQTIDACRQALCLHQELENTEGQAGTWDSLGYAHHHLGHHDEAISCYEQALELYHGLGDRYNQATILGHVGDTHHATGNLQAARDAWQQGLVILEQLDHAEAGPLRAKLSTL